MSYLHRVSVVINLIIIVAAHGIANAESTAEMKRKPSSIPLPCSTSEGRDWQPGVDYIAFVVRQETYAPPGKVSVVLRFLDTAPIDRDLQRYVAHWQQNKPEYVHLERRPSIRFPHARSQARMYFTLQEVAPQRLDSVHDDLLKWIWDTPHYPTYHNILHPNESAIAELNRSFALQHGISKAAFEKVYFSNEMDEKLLEEEVATHAAAESMAVVNGRYGTNLGRVAHGDLAQMGTVSNFDRFFALIECLAAFEAKDL